MTEKDELYIRKCVELASAGEGYVSPNPLVGAVVLDKDGNIAGTGYHKKYGQAHAEVHALDEAGEKAKGGTLYVNLEPCAHFGKTPPCCERVKNSGIKKLVIGMVDPNPLVCGCGLDAVEKSGIEVVTGVLEAECKKLNEIFIKYITKKQPFIAIKTASTIDGKIATKTGSSKWITSEAARAEVQRLRNKYDAILTGSGTIIADNPSLTCRMEGGRNPIRIIIDSELKTSPTSKVYNDDGTRVIVACSEHIEVNRVSAYAENVEIWPCPVTKEGRVKLNYLFNKLHKKKIAGVLVEAGGILNGVLLKEHLADKLYLFTAPKILGDSQAKSMVEGFNIEDINDSLNLRFDEIKKFDPDVMIEAYTS